MKKFIKQIAFVMALALVVTSFAAAAPAEAATISLGKKSKTLYVGGAKGFYLKEDGTKVASTVKGTYSSLKKQVKGLSKTDTVRFTSDNKAVATVYPNSGKIKANGKGTATITCTVRNKAGKKIATLPFKVTVNNNAKEIKIVNAPANGVVPIGEKAYDLNGDYGKATTTDKATWKLVEGADIAAIDAAGVITTKKAGKFKVQAYTYQSKTFKGATAESTVLELEAAASLAGVKASGIRSFTATFDSNMTDLVDRTKFGVYYMLNGAERAVSIDTVTVDKKDETGKTVKVTLFNNFQEDTEYFVKYTADGEKFSFKLASLDSIDVKDIVLNNPVIEVAADSIEGEKLDFTLLNEAGVDLTAAFGDNVSFSTDDYNVCTLADNKIKFYQSKQKATVKATYSVSYLDEDKQYRTYTFDKSFSISSVDPTPVSYTVSDWSVVQAGGSFDKALLRTNVAVNDVSATLEGTLISSKDNKAYNFAEFSFESANEAVLVMSANRVIMPVKEGSTSIIVRDSNAKVVATFPIAVTQKRVPASISLIKSRNQLNVSGSDKLNVQVKVMDNYNMPLDGVNLSVELPTTSTLELATETTNTGKDGIGNVVVTSGGDKVANLPVDTNKSVTYNVIADKNDVKIKSSFSFITKKVSAGSTITNYAITADKSSFDTTITNETTGGDEISFTVGGYNKEGFFIQDVSGLVYSSKAEAKAAAPQATATDGKAFYFTVNAKEISGASASTFFTKDHVTPVSASGNDELKKLAKGNYTIALIEATSGKDATVTHNAIALTITDKQPVPTVTIKADSASSIGSFGDVAECFAIRLPGAAEDSTVTDGDLVIGSTATFVKSLSIKIAANGSKYFTLSVPINASVKQK